MPGSSNFIQQNPTQANQETDSAYQADPLTTGGISLDAILPSKWLNKYYYQQSTFVAAFCQMMANKGYTMSDASITTLEAVLANVLTTADTKPPLVTVASSPTPVFDCNTANGFSFVIASNVTSCSLINMQIGQTVTIVLQQNSIGGYSFAAPSAIQSGHWWPVDTGANVYTVQQFIKTPTGNIVRVDTSELDLQAAINVINSTLTTISGQISTLNGQVSTLNSEVATLTSDISTINTEISGINSSITTLSSTVSGLQSQVTNLNTIVNPIPGEITSLQTDVSALIAAFASSLTTNGYQKFYGGLIIQWGQVMTFGNTPNISFPIAFPSACIGGIATDNGPYVNGKHSLGFSVVSRFEFSISDGSSGTEVFWVAIGF